MATMGVEGLMTSLQLPLALMYYQIY